MNNEEEYMRSEAARQLAETTESEISYNEASDKMYDFLETHRGETLNIPLDEYDTWVEAARVFLAGHERDKDINPEKAPTYAHAAQRIIDERPEKYTTAA